MAAWSSEWTEWSQEEKETSLSVPVIVLYNSYVYTLYSILGKVLMNIESSV